MEGNGETNTETVTPSLLAQRKRINDLTEEYNHLVREMTKIHGNIKIVKKELAEANDKFTTQTGRVFMCGWEDFSGPPPEVPDDVWNSFDSPADKDYWKNMWTPVEVNDAMWSLLKLRYPTISSSPDSARVKRFIAAPEYALIWQVAAKNKDAILAASSDEEIREVVSADFAKAIPALWEKVPWTWINTRRCDATDCWYARNNAEWDAYYELKLKGRVVYLCNVCIKADDSRQARAYELEMKEYLTEQLCDWFGKRET